MSETKQNKDQQYRTLFVGLGGTGGRVLLNLNKLLTKEQKEKSHMIYIDLDKGDAEDIEALGMPAVVISSSDTVRDVIGRLGPNDGVNDWIPTAANDKEFLSSKTDDGASQYRMKSRLCLANFLKNRNNKLAKLLTELCTVGSQVSDETLRVMIVSSVAGGTGAGTFIEVALYIREFFRNKNHKDVNIMGLFACPDLFVKTLGDRPGDRTNLENMYANAYAAIRELNAMNLAVSTGGLEKIAPGYGKSINIKIHTRAEGKLFDPKDEKFLENANNKPFNLMYFVDAANEEGGVLTSIDQYYAVMADIVHTRLYSPIEKSIRSGESNELGPHSKYPTAIYGSAGYGRIIYPYEDIIRYLAVRKTAEEIGGAWFFFEDSWKTFSEDQEAIATETGGQWSAKPEIRAHQYITDMDTALEDMNPMVISMKGMLFDDETGMSRVEQYLLDLEAALTSGDGLDEELADGKYSRCKDEKLSELRKNICNTYRNMNAKTSDPLNTLQKNATGAVNNLREYARKLTGNMEGKSLSVANNVIPQNETAAANDEVRKNPLSLQHGLLSVGGAAVHPLAARYLLYKLREALETRTKAAATQESVIARIQALEMACDPNKKDDVEVTISKRISELEKAVWFPVAQATDALQTFNKVFKNVITEVTADANSMFIAAVCKRLLEYVEELIRQYEGLFDNMEQYKLDLDRRSRQESVRNNSSSDDRCIFVNASSKAKAYIYERDALTRNALREGDREIAAAAGKGIYTALMERTWKKLEAKKLQTALRYTEEEEKDTYSDMGAIFDSVVELYTKYLQEKAPHLQVSVVQALVKQCCLTEGVEEKELSKDAAKRYRVRMSFEKVVRDMIAKSYPMLAYDPHNADTYYQNEDGNTETKYYMHIGMAPSVVEDLLVFYGENDAKSAKEGFESVFAPSKGLTVSEAYDKYRISCFSAVHCLQPTQILKFREDFDAGYYYYYKKRLAMITNTDCLSFTPHLDKRWHLREAMPYISRSMELEWHKKTTKAFIYEMLNEKFTFTTAADGVKCFNYVRNEQEAPIFVHWPANRLVTVNDISRLIEYLEEQDERVEELNAKFDAMIENMLAVLSKHTEDMATYKTALTKHPTLRMLRESLCYAMSYTSSTMANKRKKKKTGTEESQSKAEREKANKLRQASRMLGCDESVDALSNIKQTLGGLLQMAWMIHKSEERQGRDKDYGEAMIACALEIVDKMCATMCGSDVATDTAANEEYKDLYNSIIEKFMEAYVKFQLAQRNMLNADALEDFVGKGCVGVGPNATFTLYNRYLKIPQVIAKTQEFGWINASWKLK